MHEMSIVTVNILYEQRFIMDLSVQFVRYDPYQHLLL